MKLAAVTFIVITIVCLILWVAQGGQVPHPAKLLPFIGGYKPSLFDIGALVMIAVAVSAIVGLIKRAGNSNEAGNSESGDTNEPNDWDEEDQTDDENA